jgi:hypothetical protein
VRTHDRQLGETCGLVGAPVCSLSLLSLASLWCASVLLACGVRTADPEAGTALLLQRWEAERAALLAELRGTADPVVRTAMVERILAAHPDQGPALCPLLPPGPAFDHCQGLQTRPHLWEAEDMGGVPPNVGLLPQRLPRVEADSWGGLSPAPTSCAGITSADTCQWNSALQSAAHGGTEAAAAACLAIGEERARWECFFQAAEQSLFASPARRVEGATRLCLGAGEFSGFCLATVTSSIVAHTPSAAWGDERAWRRLAASVAELEDALRPWDPELGAELARAVWSVATAMAFSSVDPVGGLPAAAVGPEVAPYVRASAAWRLAQLEQQPHDAAWWVERVDRAMTAEAIDEDAPAPEPWERTAPRWHAPAPGGPGTIPYLYGGRRAWSPEPRADTMICVIEGLELVGAAPDALLFEAVDWGDPALRATAIRILAAHSRPRPGPSSPR